MTVLMTLLTFSSEGGSNRLSNEPCPAGPTEFMKRVLLGWRILLYNTRSYVAQVGFKLPTW